MRNVNKIKESIILKIMVSEKKTQHIEIEDELIEKWRKELYEIVKKSYCYKELTKKDFNDILSYLAGEFADLQDRHIYAKIWRKEGKLGKRGKLARVLYMTNIGTIPDESYITVKSGDKKIGKLDEGFLERLKPGDIFVSLSVLISDLCHNPYILHLSILPYLKNCTDHQIHILNQVCCNH